MKVCLCGSTRFMDQFHAANVALSLAGHIVYSVATSTKGDFQPTEDQKLALDAVHLLKIQESDVVMVVGRQEDGSLYIGESTRREIMFARLNDKDVLYWQPEKELGGPFKQFEIDIKAAAETSAERADRKAKADAKRRKFMEEMGLDVDKLDRHTGEPDCPACKEDADEDEVHTH